LVFGSGWPDLGGAVFGGPLLEPPGDPVGVFFVSPRDLFGGPLGAPFSGGGGGGEGEGGRGLFGVARLTSVRAYI
jgi:hypothetical protein